MITNTSFYALTLNTCSPLNDRRFMKRSPLLFVLKLFKDTVS